MKAQNDAAVAALKAAWPAGKVYRVGDDIDGTVTPYAIVNVSSGAPRNYRATSQSFSRYHYLTVQVIGDTYNEAAALAEKVDATFLDKRITVAGFTCTPCRRPGADVTITRDPDGGVLMYGAAIYSFTATPAS